MAQACELLPSTARNYLDYPSPAHPPPSFFAFLPVSPLHIRPGQTNQNYRPKLSINHWTLDQHPDFCQPIIPARTPCIHLSSHQCRMERANDRRCIHTPEHPIARGPTATATLQIILPHLTLPTRPPPPRAPLWLKGSIVPGEEGS